MAARRADSGHMPGDAAHLVTITTTGDSFLCHESTNVVVGMTRRGAVGVPVGCRGGGCGVCRTQILSGTYTTKVMSRAHVTAEDIAAGVVLACRVFPTSDLVVRPLDPTRSIT